MAKAHQCPQCGAPLPVRSEQCEYCGAQITGQQHEQTPARPPVQYGVPNPQYQRHDNGYLPPYMQQPAVPQKNRALAALLAIFLGTLGVHHFYLGRTALGVIFAVVTLASIGAGTCLTAPISIIEGIVILCMSDETFAQKYNKY